MKVNRSAVLSYAFAISTIVPDGPRRSAGWRSRHTLDMTVVNPESAGFSAERIERLHAAMKQVVDNKDLSGMVTILARHGKVVDYWNYGQRDMASGAPMNKDTIFRDFSMTKPVTGVAMMILYEQGKWLPSDPISKFIPEFAHLKVYKGVDAMGRLILEDPDHLPTISELMSHSAGFTYGFFGNTPVDQMYRDAKLFESKSLKEFIDKLAAIPLTYQPGKGWTYSVSMDIEGYIVEKISGQSLPDFIRDNIYQPLAMKDAGFFVPARQARSRFHPSVYITDDQGKMVPASEPGRFGGNHFPGSSPACLQAGAAWSRRRRIIIASPRCAGQWRRTRRQAHPCPGHRQADGFSNHLAPELLHRTSTGSACNRCGEASATATTVPSSTIRRPPIFPTAKTRFSGMAPPAPGSGSTPPMTSCLSA